VIQRELGERLLDYGVRVIKVVEAMPGTLVGRRIGDQLLRCGTSVGANYEESRAAESTADFVHKLQVSLKELAGIPLLAEALIESKDAAVESIGRAAQ
jgi:four helix bundle protein